ncbi:MAG: DUF1302 domain-containing protein [Burkholderiales bacterium]|nr:DUF1302 domain-containing protein [Burkholderiales bacterium]
MILKPIGKSSRLAATTLAAALLLASATHARAFEFETEGGWKGTFNNTISAAASWRAQAPDSALYSEADGIRAGYGPGGTGGSNTDSGTLNWDKGGRFATPIKLLSELSLHKGDLGAFLRVKAWYDQALNDEGVRAGNGDQDPMYSRGAPLSDASQPNLNKFQGIALLDAYVYDTFAIGGKPLQLRAGRQVVNWGESLFIQGVNQLNPIDVPALQRPGTEVKEALLPVWSLYGNLGFGNGASLELFYQLKWEQTIVDSCGGYWSPVEWAISTSPGSGCRAVATTLAGASNFDQVNAGLYVPLGQGSDGKNSNQWGLAFRLPVDAIDSELGIYAMRINSRVPIVSARTGTSLIGTPLQEATGLINAIPALAPLGLTSATGLWEYPNGINIYGASLSTNLAGWSVGAEVSYTPNQPVQINGNDLLQGVLTGIGPMGDAGIAATMQGSGAYVSGYDRMRKYQFQANTIKVLPAMLGAAQGLLIAEAGMQWNDLPNNGRRYGRAFIFGFASDDSVPFGGSTCTNPVPPLVNPQQDGCRNDGFVTKFAWGYRLRASLEYPGLIGGFSVTPNVFWGHDVSGYSSDTQFIEGRQALGLGVRFEYQKRYALDLGYTSFSNSAKYDPFRDRDYYAASLSMTF